MIGTLVFRMSVITSLELHKKKLFKCSIVLNHNCSGVGRCFGKVDSEGMLFFLWFKSVHVRNHFGN